jgi:competence protein ComEC
MSKKISYPLIISLILLPFAILSSLPSKHLHFIACDVGQGDAILLTRGFTQVLIDGGPNDQVLNCLSENMPFYDRTLELVVNTHPDADHITGLSKVIKRYQIKQVLAHKFDIESNIAKEFYTVLKEKEIPFYSPQAGEKIKLAGLQFKVLWPEQKYDTSHAAVGQLATQTKVLGGKTNENSIVLHLQYKDFDALLTGDITEKEEKEIIKDYQFKDIEVLKVAHHGSKYSSSQEFLQAVKPQIAIISVGKNSWGHPTGEVLDRLQLVGAKILRTDKDKIKLKI